VVGLILRPLYPHGKSPGTHWIGGWVSHRAGPDVVAKRVKLFIAPVGN